MSEEAPTPTIAPVTFWLVGNFGACPYCQSQLVIVGDFLQCTKSVGRCFNSKWKLPSMLLEEVRVGIVLGTR